MIVCCALLAAGVIASASWAIVRKKLEGNVTSRCALHGHCTAILLFGVAVPYQHNTQFMVLLLLPKYFFQ